MIAAGETLMKNSAVLALIAGLFGGLISRYIAPPVAFAQNQPAIAFEVRARSFVLVDPSDRTAGTFAVEMIPDRTGGINRAFSSRIVLRDASGRSIWSAGGTGIQPLVTQ
jgi:hypothetical protein